MLLFSLFLLSVYVFVSGVFDLLLPVSNVISLILNGSAALTDLMLLVSELLHKDISYSLNEA